MLFFDIFATPKKIWPHFFKFLAHFKAFTPPVCGFISKSFLRNISKLLNIIISMYNSNTDSLGLILDVEVFFLWVTVQEHCELNIFLVCGIFPGCGAGGGSLGTGHLVTASGCCIVMIVM